MTKRPGMDRPAFSVALVGPDGAGKTTIARRLERDHPLPVRYLYMGLNPAAGGAMLPTTRLLRRLRPARVAAAGGPPDPTRARPRPRSAGQRAAVSVRSALRFGNLLAEEWYRQLRAATHMRRGRVVVFDRHFTTDFRAHDRSTDRSLPLSRRLHGLLLERAYPRPDLVICLDAPPEVLYERKPEGSVELLAGRRQEYLDLTSAARPPREVVVLDANRPLDSVVRDVFDVVSAFASGRKE